MHVNFSYIVGLFSYKHSIKAKSNTLAELRSRLLHTFENEDADEMMRLLADLARRSGTRRVSVRVQGDYEEVYRRLIAARGRVRWSDLRMTYAGHAEPVPAQGMVLSNWEI